MTGLIVDSSGLTLSAGGLFLETGLGSATLEEGGGVWGEAQLTAYLASLSDGLFYDFTRTDRHFQEHTGPTLADDIGEVIGLALDQRTWGSGTLAQVLAAQPELVANGDFSSALSGWTAVGDNISTLAAVGGRWRATATGSASGWFGGYTVLTNLTIGKTYIVAVQATLQSGWNSFSNFVLTVMDGAGVTSIVGANRSTAGLLQKYFVATATSHAVRLRAEGDYVNGVSYAEFDDLSVKLVPGYSALQSTGAAKPTRQTSGAKFDGSDDSLLTAYSAGSGANFLVALVTIPSSIPTTQVLIGAENPLGNRFLLMVRTTGRLDCGIGAFSGPGTGDDLRGQRVVIGLTNDGSGNFRLFANDATLRETTHTGAAADNLLRLGCNSTTSTNVAAGFSSCSIEKVVAGRKYLTPSAYLQIRAALLA